MEKIKKDLIIKVRDVKDLLMAPTQDPLSDYEYVQSGESALIRAIRFINIEKYKYISSIDVYLPHAEGNIDEIRRMIHHYLNFCIKENNKELILFKRNTTRIFRNAVIFLIICMAIVTMIGVESFIPNLPPLMRTVLTEGITVMGWVIMWRPIELVLNQWTELKIENKIYQKLLNIPIQIFSS